MNTDHFEKLIAALRCTRVAEVWFEFKFGGTPPVPVETEHDRHPPSEVHRGSKDQPAKYYPLNQ